MSDAVRESADRVLRGVVEQENGVPGVVAMATDRSGNFYEGAEGVRELGKDDPMTTDTVFAIFSCTKAITGVAVMQLVEEGEISLSDPAKEYAPEIANVQVLEGFDESGEPRTRAPKSDVTVEQLMLHTARAMGDNGLGEMKIKLLPGAIPSLSNDAEFFPGMPKSWGYTFMINDEDAPTGRPAGELGWAGLANLYYWIDRKNGIGGFWATQIFPFADPVSFTGYMDFETAVYEAALSPA
ncbi:MAG: serine hydrolase domain-containing protein [Rubrobacteraceae bacterium]